MIATVYERLASGGKKAETQDAAERLFAINRGALLRNGIKLPVELRISGTLTYTVANHTGRLLEKASLAAGLEKSRLDSPRYTLSLILDGQGFVSCELYDNVRGIAVWSDDLPFSASDRGRPQRAAISRFLREGIFNAF